MKDERSRQKESHSIGLRAEVVKRKIISKRFKTQSKKEKTRREEVSSELQAKESSVFSW